MGVTSISSTVNTDAKFLFGILSMDLLYCVGEPRRKGVGRRDVEKGTNEMNQER